MDTATRAEMDRRIDTLIASDERKQQLKYHAAAIYERMITNNSDRIAAAISLARARR